MGGGQTRVLESILWYSVLLKMARHFESFLFMEEEYEGTIKTRRACNQRRAACLLSMQNARNFLYEDTSDVSRIMMTFHVSAHPANWLDKDPYKKG